tara:strand:+ start:1517 stop:1723 length:207 start_codon:yes stop_codon:yes gene_type:complete
MKEWTTEHKIAAVEETIAECKAEMKTSELDQPIQNINRYYSSVGRLMAEAERQLKSLKKTLEYEKRVK